MRLRIGRHEKVHLTRGWDECAVFAVFGEKHQFGIKRIMVAIAKWPIVGADQALVLTKVFQRVTDGGPIRCACGVNGFRQNVH